MITYSNGHTEKVYMQCRNSAAFKKQQTLPADEYLYHYLIANTALRAYDEGLPDEEHKVLKYFGVKYWEPGMEEVQFEDKNYKVNNTKKRIAIS
jgi:hypothetical protein